MARSTSETLVLPLAFNSLAVMTCTALAPSFSLTRIFEPVTLTRSMSSSAWARERKAAAMARLMARGVNMISSYLDGAFFGEKRPSRGTRTGWASGKNDDGGRKELRDAWTGTHRHRLRHALHGQLVRGGIKIGRKTKS